MLFSMAGVNAAENDSTYTNITNDNIIQEDQTNSTINGTGDQTDTTTYQASAEDPTGFVTVEEVETAATNLKNYVETHKTLPDTIEVGSKTLTMAQFLKVLLTTTIHLDQGIIDSINIDAVDDAPNPAGQNISDNILKSGYLEDAINILNFMDSYGRAPNYWSTSIGNLRFENLVLSYANIMDFNENNNRLPNYTKIRSSDFKWPVTVEEIETASIYLKNYANSHKALPATIQVGSNSLTMSEFLRVLMTTVINLDQNVSTSVDMDNVNNAPSPAGVVISGNILKSEYLKNATTILNFIDSNGRAPNYTNTSFGNLRFEYMVYNFAKIMDFHKDYNRLPNYTIVQTSAMSYELKENYSYSVSTSGLNAVARYINQNFNHRSGASTTAAGVLKTGYGDCWGLADLAAQELSKSGYKVRVVQGASSGSYNHRWVQYYAYGKWNTFESTMITQRYGSKHYSYAIASVRTVIKYY